ncbi:hypothetical protein HWV62_13805 [Athelia sp. TMB]|nr:hypothetical protein HWV62_13805 [Athelia sp. TMB]
MVIHHAVISTSSVKCETLDGCRSLYSIVQSCIVTILACVWFAVHRNISAPRPVRPHYGNFFTRILGFVWSKILDQRQAAIVFLVALLAPEWVLAWAFRQLLEARRLAKQLEMARAEAIEDRKQTTSHMIEAVLDPKESKDALDETLDGSSAASVSSGCVRQTHKLKGVIACRKCDQQCEQCGLHCSVDAVHMMNWDPIVVAKRVAKGDEAWSTPHAFFVIMGGYCFYNETGLQHPLSPKHVVELVRRGHIVSPTSEELASQSKGDALSKGVALMQTLWFVLQCIVRRIEHLPVTSLEVMTLAYTAITIAMYIVWWSKPLNVSCAIRVPEEQLEAEEEKPRDISALWDRIVSYIVGWQDDHVNLRRCTQVPTFWVGRANHGTDYTMFVNLVEVLVAMVFGAVHCIAWSYTFHSHLEQQLWRASAIVIIAVPAALPVVLALASLILALWGSERLFRVILCTFCVPLTLLYAAARLTLIVIAFMSLRILPFAAYQTVQWTTFLPHI